MIELYVQNNFIIINNEKTYNRELYEAFIDNNTLSIKSKYIKERNNDFYIIFKKSLLDIVDNNNVNYQSLSELVNLINNNIPQIGDNPRFWNNNGKPFWFDGVTNYNLLDFITSQPTDAFGNSLV